MKSEYLNYPNIRISKSGFESNSYPDFPNYPDLWICFLCDLQIFLMYGKINYFIIMKIVIVFITAKRKTSLVLKIRLKFCIPTSENYIIELKYY